MIVSGLLLVSFLGLYTTATLKYDYRTIEQVTGSSTIYNGKRGFSKFVKMLETYEAGGGDTVLALLTVYPTRSSFPDIKTDDPERDITLHWVRRLCRTLGVPNWSEMGFRRNRCELVNKIYQLKTIEDKEREYEPDF
jgi:hypothetical protein